MSASDRSDHLIERAAALLRDDAGLGAAPFPAPPPASAAPGTASFHPTDVASEGPAMPVTMAQLAKAGLVLGGSRNRTTEEYRICVGRLVRALRQLRAGAANLVMVTSPRPGEGKSFSALNMAASIALNGVSDVLLVDCDAKPASVSTQLEQRHQTGLYDIATDLSIPVSHVVMRTEISGLSFLPIGHVGGHDKSGFTTPMLQCIERIARAYPHHVVVLDTPPCLSTSDPSTLAQIADIAVMIVQAERTQRSEIEASLELMQHCPNIMMMLNQMRTHTQASFGNYYYYGYPG